MRKNELVCLGLIYSKPNYVYALDHAIKVFKMNEWVNLSRSSIYNTLGKLVKLTYVELSIEKHGNMPDRKVYTITSEGKRRLKEAVIKIIQDVSPTENLYYLAIGFFFDLEPDEAIQLLKERREKFAQRIRDFEASYLDAEQNAFHHIELQCQAGIKHSQVEVALIDELISKYEKEPMYFSKGLIDFYTEVVFNSGDEE